MIKSANDNVDYHKHVALYYRQVDIIKPVFKRLCNVPRMLFSITQTQAKSGFVDLSTMCITHPIFVLGAIDL